MIVKMSQKDSEEDIEKAYNLFVDQEKNSITFASLKRVVDDLSTDWIRWGIDGLANYAIDPRGQQQGFWNWR